MFLLFLLPHQHILSSFKNISVHFYANDILLYVSRCSWAGDAVKLLRLYWSWTADSFLQTDEEKTGCCLCPWQICVKGDGKSWSPESSLWMLRFYLDHLRNIAMWSHVTGDCYSCTHFIIVVIQCSLVLAKLVCNMCRTQSLPLKILVLGFWAAWTRSSLCPRIYTLMFPEDPEVMRSELVVQRTRLLTEGDRAPPSVTSTRLSLWDWAAALWSLLKANKNSSL